MKHLFLLIFSLAWTPAFAGSSVFAGSWSAEIGSPSLFHCFVSTVAVNLEPRGPGSRFPALGELERGTVVLEHLSALRTQLLAARVELSKLPPSKVVWDMDDRSQQPPWGNHISPAITSLGNYFVTSDGKDLFAVLLEAIQHAQATKAPIKLQ